MAFAVSVYVGNIGPTMRQLDGLKSSLKNKIVRTWMMKAGRVIKNEAKRRAPVLRNRKKYPHLIPGLLKKSIDVKTKTYKTGVTVAIIGPRTDYRSVRDPASGKVVRQTKKNATRFAAIAQGGAFIQNPVKYAHFFELGTNKMAARPFLRPAGESKRGEVMAIGVRVINEELNKLASKRVV